MSKTNVDFILEAIDEILGKPAVLEHDELRLEIPTLLMKQTEFGDTELHGQKLRVFLATPFSALDLTVVLGPAPSFDASTARRREGSERGYHLELHDVVLECPDARILVKRLLAEYSPSELTVVTHDVGVAA